MESIQAAHAIFITLIVVSIDSIVADFEYMVSVPESIALPIGYNTKLICEMNIEPDKFQWKFYPLKDPFNPRDYADLTSDRFEFVPEKNFTMAKRRSALAIEVKSTKVAGDYQCLAYYGAYVVASVPWRITIMNMQTFPEQRSINEAIVMGNTVTWKCIPPQSNPEAYIDYSKNGVYIKPFYSEPSLRSLILPSVGIQDTGVYRCNASNTNENLSSTAYFNMTVVKPNAKPLKGPYFIQEHAAEYTVSKGDSVLLECSAIGNPPPIVKWYKVNSEMPRERTVQIKGGLQIKNIRKSDGGKYVCSHTNSLGTIEKQILLIYNEEPYVDCLLTTTDVKQGENLELDCNVTGIPKPSINWLLNGFSINNDSSINVNESKISFTPVEKRHAGNLQCFATNVEKSVYSSVSIRVIPLPASIDTTYAPSHSHHRQNTGKAPDSKKPTRHNKHNKTKMVPPSKPSISRLNDEGVVVSWSVPSNNGLPIQFFKVQYRELGPIAEHDHHGKGSRWKTTNPDLAPNIMAYDVTNLKPDFIYKFRVAAVYTNNDNKLSPNSDKFYLRRLDFDKKNPLPVPLITHTETVNASSVRIYWEYESSPNTSTNGFYINYIKSTSAGDYMKATAEGENTRSFVITHLQPGTQYDIKMQSFTSKFASEFSSIMKAKTAELPSVSASNEHSTTTPVTEEEGDISSLYIIIGVVTIAFAIIISFIVLFLIYRKGRRDLPTGEHDKPAVEEHHIQADSNDYVVSPKSLRANGCLMPPNRITITPNPLADADNKNQNMIEMSRLTTQNNNSTTQPSGSAEESPSNTKGKHKINSKDQTRRSKHNIPDSTAPGENYV